LAATWRERCNQIFVDLRGYLAGSSVSPFANRSAVRRVHEAERNAPFAAVAAGNGHSHHNHCIESVPENVIKPFSPGGNSPLNSHLKEMRSRLIGAGT